jgi:hypothetical protein
LSPITRLFGCRWRVTGGAASALESRSLSAFASRASVDAAVVSAVSGFEGGRAATGASSAVGCGRVSGAPGVPRSATASSDSGAVESPASGFVGEIQVGAGKLLESMALETPSAYARREHEVAIDERTWKVVPEETARLRAGAPTYASWSSSSASS